ncbi:MAG: hypothetical protein WC975_15165 [Phycisphaerae bacterium]
MKKLVMTMVVLVVFGAASLAFAQDMRDSSNWERGFEFTTNPTSGWSNWNGNPGPVTSVAGGVLNFKPTVDWTLWNTNSGSNPLGTGDWSYEWRVQVVSIVSDNYSTDNISLYADTNSSKENVNFSVHYAAEGQVKGHFGVSPTDPVTAGQLYTVAIDASAYHVYRLTRTTGTTGTLIRCYLDNNTSPFFSQELTMKTKNSDNMLGFGNGNATGEYNVDYIRWTTSGAYAPVGLDPVTVTGTVVPGSGVYLGDFTELSVTIEFRQGGVLKHTATPSLVADGSFTILMVNQGIYDVSVKIPGLLTKVLPAVNISANPTVLGSINMINGDSDGDNEITSTDLSVVLANMDLVGD